MARQREVKSKIITLTDIRKTKRQLRGLAVATDNLTLKMLPAAKAYAGVLHEKIIDLAEGFKFKGEFVSSIEFEEPYKTKKVGDIQYYEMKVYSRLPYSKQLEFGTPVRWLFYGMTNTKKYNKAMANERLNKKEPPNKKMSNTDKLTDWVYGFPGYSQVFRRASGEEPENLNQKLNIRRELDIVETRREKREFDFRGQPTKRSFRIVGLEQKVPKGFLKIGGENSNIKLNKSKRAVFGPGMREFIKDTNSRSRYVRSIRKIAIKQLRAKARTK